MASLAKVTFICFEVLDVVEGGGEVLVEGPVDDVGDVGPEGVAGAGVDVVLVDVLEGHVAGLEDVEDSPHVSLAQRHQSLLPVLGDVDPLLLADQLQPGQDLLLLQRTKPEPGAAALEGGDDLAQVVADHTEPHVVSELLYDSPQCILGIIRHRVGLVQNDQFVAAEITDFHLKDSRASSPSGLPFEHCSGGSKVHDLPPHDANTAVVTGVQLQHHRAKLLGRIDLLGAGQDGAGLPGPRRAVEQEVGQLVILNEGSDGVYDVLVRDQLVQGIGPVLLHPGKVHTGLTFFRHHQFQDVLRMRFGQIRSDEGG